MWTDYVWLHRKQIESKFKIFREREWTYSRFTDHVLFTQVSERSTSPRGAIQSSYDSDRSMDLMSRLFPSMPRVELFQALKAHGGTSLPVLQCCLDSSWNRCGKKRETGKLILAGWVLSMIMEPMPPIRRRQAERPRAPFFVLLPFHPSWSVGQSQGCPFIYFWMSPRPPILS